jgi:hypothetical protein
VDEQLFRQGGPDGGEPIQERFRVGPAAEVVPDGVLGVGQFDDGGRVGQLGAEEVFGPAVVPGPQPPFEGGAGGPEGAVARG